MAKRRRLTAPDAEELREIETGFAAKPPESAPPIAQVAGEAAALAGLAGVTDRAAVARDAAEAARFRDAQQAGLVAEQVPVAEIDTGFLRRDRIIEDEEEMEELVASIRAHGLRAPIEVVRLEEGYGLISGWRRLRALRRLAAEQGGHDTVPAFIRDGIDGAPAYVTMVEENEVRAALSHYERGRIAVLAAGQGVFGSVEEAVDVLFAAASKAKRSKVRSFALVHEALGDVLRFPAALSERLGLRLAAALRDGQQARLRAALAAADCRDAGAEGRVLKQALKGLSEAEKDPARGGRPSAVTRLRPVPLRSGGELRAELSGRGLRIDLEGRVINPDTAERIMAQIRRMLD